jgi:hypothetical protein
MVRVAISNITDPDGDTFTIRVTGVTQDEPVNAKNQGRREPDATGVGTAAVRAERDGRRQRPRLRHLLHRHRLQRRVRQRQRLGLRPHDQGGNSTCTDDGQAYIPTEL